LLFELAATGKSMAAASKQVTEMFIVQYFYTIKDLRDAVRQFAHDETKESVDHKLTEDDLKRHRVGGRLVTKREIIRSRKCMSMPV
jgi:hypothetical protein